jgi:hypothetical protein
MATATCRSIALPDPNIIFIEAVKWPRIRGHFLWWHKSRNDCRKIAMIENSVPRSQRRAAKGHVLWRLQAWNARLAKALRENFP